MTKLPRSTPALVIAVALLVLLTTTGGAVAGGLITGKKIKDNTITSADIKNGTIAKSDLSKTARGTTGPQGDPGPQGPRGFSAWDTIPSGVTVTGELVMDTSTTGSGSSDRISVDLPGTAPVPLTTAMVNFKSGASVVDSDASCVGTTSDPTAPAGKVCLYLVGTTGAMTSVNGAIESLPSRAFVVSWVPSGAAGTDMYLYATWAYTAP